MRIVQAAFTEFKKEVWQYGPVVIVQGNTFPVKDILSSLGFKWSGARKCWYMPENQYSIKASLINERLKQLGVTFPESSNSPESQQSSPAQEKKVLEGEEYPLKGDSSMQRDSEEKTRKRYRFPIRKNILQFVADIRLKDDTEVHNENVIINRYFKKGVTSDNWKVTFNAEYADYPLYEAEIGTSVITGGPILTITKSFMKDGKAWGTYDEPSFILSEMKRIVEEVVPLKFTNNFLIEYDYRKRDPELGDFLKSIEGLVYSNKNELYSINLNTPKYNGSFSVTVLHNAPLKVFGYPNVNHPKAPEPGFSDMLFDVSLYKIHTVEEFDAKIKEILNNQEVIDKYVKYLDSFPYISGDQKEGYEDYKKVIEILRNPSANIDFIIGKIKAMGYVRESLRGEKRIVIDTKKVLNDIYGRDISSPEYFYILIAYQLNYYFRKYHERAFIQYNLFSFVDTLSDILNKYGDEIKPRALTALITSISDACYTKIFGSARSRNTWENFKNFYSDYWSEGQQNNVGQKVDSNSQTGFEMLKDLAEINEIPVNDIQTDAKKIYWQLAKKLHPDKNPGNPEEATEQFKALQKIWEMIPDSIKNASDWYSRVILASSRETRAELLRMGAEVIGDKVCLYRGGNVSPAKLKNLRYNDFLSTVRDGTDAYGNAGASSYGKNVIEVILPISQIKITNGEIQYIGESKSLSGGQKYPIEIYRAFNDALGSNYTTQEIDKFRPEEVRGTAYPALSGGKEEFDQLMKNFQVKRHELV